MTPSKRGPLEASLARRFARSSSFTERWANAGTAYRERFKAPRVCGWGTFEVAICCCMVATSAARCPVNCERRDPAGIPPRNLHQHLLLNSLDESRRGSEPGADFKIATRAMVSNRGKPRGASPVLLVFKSNFRNQVAASSSFIRTRGSAQGATRSSPFDYNRILHARTGWQASRATLPCNPLG